MSEQAATPATPNIRPASEMDVLFGWINAQGYLNVLFIQPGHFQAFVTNSQQLMYAKTEARDRKPSTITLDIHGEDFRIGNEPLEIYYRLVGDDVLYGPVLTTTLFHEGIQPLTFSIDDDGFLTATNLTINPIGLVITDSEDDVLLETKVPALTALKIEKDGGNEPLNMRQAMRIINWIDPLTKRETGGVHSSLLL